MMGWAPLLCVLGCQKPAPSVQPPQPVSVWAVDALDPAPGPPAVLRFDWRPGATADVAVRVEAHQLNGDTLSSRTVTAVQWVEELRASVDGYRLAQRDGAGGTEITPPPAAEEAMEAVMTALALASAETVIGEDGRWVGADRIDGMRSEVVGRMAPVTERLPGPLREALVRTFEQGLTDEVVEEDSERRWSALVGGWIGRRLEVGVPLSTPVDGGAEQVVVLLGWVPCTPSAAERECVVLETEVRASEAEVERARQAVSAAMEAAWPAGQTGPTLEQSEIFTRETLVTRPETLRPTLHHKHKAAAHGFRLEDRIIPWGRDIRTTTTWTWRPTEAP